MCQVVFAKTLLLLNIYLSLSNPASIIQSLVKCIKYLYWNKYIVCVFNFDYVGFSVSPKFRHKTDTFKLLIRVVLATLSHHHFRHYSTAVHVVGWSPLFRKMSKTFATYQTLANNLHTASRNLNSIHWNYILRTIDYWRQTSISLLLARLNLSQLIMLAGSQKWNENLETFYISLKDDHNGNGCDRTLLKTIRIYCQHQRGSKFLQQKMD